MIQGKQIAMHYSNPRPKFEDWLCNKVQCVFLSVSHHFSSFHQLRDQDKAVHSLGLVVVTTMEKCKAQECKGSGNPVAETPGVMELSMENISS